VLPLARENEGEKEALLEERVNIRDLHQTIEDTESDLDSFDGDSYFPDIVKKHWRKRTMKISRDVVLQSHRKLKG
jgi:hypothetical protein